MSVYEKVNELVVFYFQKNVIYYKIKNAFDEIREYLS